MQIDYNFLPSAFYVLRKNMVVISLPLSLSLFSLFVSFLLLNDDETLPIINKPKHPKKRRNIRNKMEGHMS